MDDNRKSYYAIIPANVRYDKRLSPNAKLLYGEITALCNEKGYCWASNAYFANLYDVSNRSITSWMKSLKDHGYISIEIIYREGTEEILHRYVRILHGGIEEKQHTPIEENFQDNNTVINNTINTTCEEGEKRKRFIPPTHEEVAEYCNNNPYPINIESFIDFYEAKGWKVGNTKMSDWKAAVRNWYRRDKGKPPSRAKPSIEENLERFRRMSDEL
ncbi:MAG: helix-turn-helix domain-containing protein [Spirochaetae bacterium HGW-Spirochaetae-5]|nr:MAG: helix-turn-helix domain-containing protein [Spirochaetae bacterium HGW-Spirochaetae-5]